MRESVSFTPTWDMVVEEVRIDGHGVMIADWEIRILLSSLTVRLIMKESSLLYVET